MEIWKDIEDYEELYQISNLGRVKSLERINNNHPIKEKILKLCKNKNGYLYVNLFKNGIRKNYRVHRLVALAFLDNPDNLPEINHINENKTDNRVCNLEWCDRKYNINYGSHNQKIAKILSKPILQFTKNGEYIKKWDCVADVERELGFNNGNISSCCNGKLKTAYNYKWCYLRNYIDNFLADWLVEYQNEVAV